MKTRSATSFPTWRSFWRAFRRRTAAPRWWNCCRSSRNIAGGGSKARRSKSTWPSTPSCARIATRSGNSRGGSAACAAGRATASSARTFPAASPTWTWSATRSATPPRPRRRPAPAVARAVPLVRPQPIGRYVVEARIGGGAFGVVYRCRDPELDRLVAIKVTRDASGGAAAFLHEAQNAAGLAHPNIVGLLDYGKLDDGRPYIVYEYVAGRTLADRIAARDYTLGEAIRWTIALAGALQAAHRRRIYHRDIKPANILVDEEGVVRLTDFGLARRDDAFYARRPRRATGHARLHEPRAGRVALGLGRAGGGHLFAGRRALRVALRPGPLPRYGPGIAGRADQGAPAGVVAFAERADSGRGSKRPASARWRRTRRNASARRAISPAPCRPRSNPARGACGWRPPQRPGWPRWDRFASARMAPSRPPSGAPDTPLKLEYPTDRRHQGPTSF